MERSVDIALIPDHEDDKPTVFEFTSSHLNDLEPSSAKYRANELIKLLNGLVSLTHNYDHRVFAIRDGRDLWTHRPILVMEENLAPTSVFPGDIESVKHIECQKPTGIINRCLFLSRYNLSLEIMFRIVGHYGFTFESLSKILDSIVYGLESKGMNPKDKLDILAALGNRSENELEDFTYTANNFGVIGIEARHGPTSKFTESLKRQALTLKQSKEIVSCVARGYIKKVLDDDFERTWEAVLPKAGDIIQTAPPPPSY